ncbi:hypothetical protein SEA_REYNAULD_44 [Rhodococcus phage Reynauld]|uniref:Uncharacterized protein n=1 Tax=Rhodococcus phage Reynauld TaxID=3062845 RepID=A0ACD4UH73_9CAUD|nr:hypothetical protein SEA_REYNAULD_44 [Rhodococcus phage Reynauld]
MDDLKAGDLVHVDGRDGVYKVVNITTTFIGLADPDFEWSGKNTDASAQFAAPREKIHPTEAQQFDISDTPASGADVNRTFG